MTEESSVKIELSDTGVMIKADAIGSLEALAFEAKAAEIPIRKYGMGELTRRDVVEIAATHGEQINKIILAFGINISKDAEAELENHPEVKVFTNDVVYRLIEEYQEWLDGTKRQTDADKRAEFPFPAKFKIIPNCIFRASKPAIVGIRVLAGRVRANLKVLDENGRQIGKIRSLRDGEDVVKEANQGDEVACALDDVTIGRQAKEDDILYIDILESSVKEFEKLDLTDDERMVLQETIDIKRKEDKFWGM
jgi:translation initiation factor 5B